MKEITGILSANGLKIAIVASRFNSFLTEQLVKGAIDAFVRLGGDERNIQLVRVPGAYEIPVVASRLASKKGGVDAVLALGAVFTSGSVFAIICHKSSLLPRTHES